MKRILILLLLLISIGVQGQSTIDHLGKIRMRYNNSGSNDTLLIQFSGDSTYYYSNTNPFHKFKSGVVADSLKLNGGGGWIKTLIPSQWTTSGSNIYYNTGNVGINNASPSYKLDVVGLIAGSNIETNTTSQSTKLGYEAGLNENETTGRKNVLAGYQAGYTLTTGVSNVIIGYRAGYTNNGGSNTFIGEESGYFNTGSANTFVGRQSGQKNTTGQYNANFGMGSGRENTTASYNSCFGYESGLNNISGTSNTILGASSSNANKYGNRNVIIGYAARFYGVNFSDELVVDNQARGGSATDSMLYRTKSLIYGTFASDPLDQTLTFNAKTNLHVHTGLFGREAVYNTTVADTWQVLKMDTLCADRTTSGFVFNADSTGVIIKFNGYVQFSGHAKLLNNAASQQTASIYFRLRKNSIEQSQFNTAVGRTFPANGAHDLVSATGVIPVSLNDTISVQLRTSNTNIDLEQIDSGIFTNQSSFCIFLTQVKSIKEFE